MFVAGVLVWANTVPRRSTHPEFTKIPFDVFGWPFIWKHHLEYSKDESEKVDKAFLKSLSEGDPQSGDLLRQHPYIRDGIRRIPLLERLHLRAALAKAEANWANILAKNVAAALAILTAVAVGCEYLIRRREKMKQGDL